MAKKMRFRYFESEEDFVKNILFIRQYFAENATNIMSKDFVFPNGVTGKELFEKYARECEKVRRYNIKYMLTPKSMRHSLPATLVYEAEYDTLYSLMEVFRTSKITASELDYVIAHSKHYFKNYFDEKLKESIVQEEME